MNRLLLLFLCAMLGACSAPKRMPNINLAENARAKETVFFVNQQEIQVDKPDVNAGGGLLGVIVEAVVESTMDKNRQAAIVPMRDTLLELDFENQFRTALMAAFPESQFAPDQKWVITRNPDDMLKAHVERNGQSFGFVSLRYAFSSNFDMLYVAATMQVGDLGLLADKNGKAKVKYMGKSAEGKYQSVAYYSVHPLKNHGKFDANVKLWAADDGKLARAALVLATEEIADLLKRDFATPLAYDAKVKKQKFWMPWIQNTIMLKASLIETKQQRVLMAYGPVIAWTQLYD